MTVQLAPLPIQRFYDNSNTPLNGGLLFSYVAGTNAKQATYTDSTGGTPNPNPIPLNYRGEAQIWIDQALAYKFVLAPATDTDPPTNPFWSVDNITGPYYIVGNLVPHPTNTFTLGTPSFSWANLYLGPNGAPVLDVTTGNFGYYARTAAEIAASVTPTNFSYPPGDVRRYGAVGNGVTDDTTALTNAHKVNQTINYPGSNFKFLINASIPVPIVGQTINGNGSTIAQGSGFVAPGGSAIAMNVSTNTTDVTVNQLNFDGAAYAGGTLNNQFLNFLAGCDRARVINCHFANQSDFATNLTGAVAFLQPNKSSYIEGCSAENMAGLIFSQGEKTLIANCWTRNCVDVSIVLHSQASIGSSIIGCKVYNEAGVRVAAHIQCEEGPSDWIISNCYVKGVNGGLGIGCFSSAVTTIVRGGLIVNNIIDGANLTTSVGGGASLIGISNFYAGVRIEGNILMGVPHGLAGCTAMSVPSLQTRIIGNRIDATAGTGNTTAIVINVAADFVDFFDNWINNTGNSRIVTMGAGNQGNARVFFKGGSFVGGSTGIDTALNSPTNCPIFFENILENTATNFYNPSAADSISTFFNTFNAWTKPHSIKQSRFIYGNAIPAAGAWNQGDTVYNSAPVVTGVYAWVCTTSGSPGTWSPVNMP